MPPTPDERLRQPFLCPLCGSNEYVFVSFPRANGSVYYTNLYRCGGCTVAFTDPLRFSVLLRSTYLVQQRWREVKPNRGPPPLRGDEVELPGAVTDWWAKRR